MMMQRVFATAACLVSLAAVALAHTPSQPPHQLYKIGDLTLESGEVIKDFAISYVTHGTLNAKKSNAILMVTAISGNHHRLDFLIGPGKALDTDKYFIICTDAIGNGLTTSPSTSTAQPHMKFPRFVIRDMVTSQKKLMEHLGIDHVVVVIGPSMGGMQTLQWGVSHPDFIGHAQGRCQRHQERQADWAASVDAETERVIQRLLRGGTGINKTAATVGVGTATVQRLKWAPFESEAAA